ncbi:preprotein translocase subunit YajC [Candidatus Tisiphia endosymbiont of Beris chalybata]|uniref:preprotein translocase subunit YajC n=1 Tax=Candidatus Tisiphia endosymbiont of Beris chalybata TaxID=3066262 RepID=UPI00312CA8E7
MFLARAYADNGIISLQEEQTTPQVAETSPYSALSSMVPMVLIFIVFYFFLIRPQEKRKREKASLISTIKKGEEVITNSGIFGVVNKVNDANDTVELEIAENVQVKILKSAILDITSRNNKQEVIRNKKVKDNKR